MSATGSSSDVGSSDAADVQYVAESTTPTSTRKEGNAAIYNPLPLTSNPHTPGSNPFSDSTWVSTLSTMKRSEITPQEVDAKKLKNNDGDRELLTQGTCNLSLQDKENIHSDYYEASKSIDSNDEEQTGKTAAVADAKPAARTHARVPLGELPVSDFSGLKKEQLSDKDQDSAAKNAKLAKAKKWEKENTIRMPAVNSAGMNHILHACKPEDPTAKDLIKQNVDRLVTMGFLTDQRKLTHDEKGMAMAETLAFDAETFESMIPDLNKVESARDQKLLQFARMRRAHERLQEAMDRIPDIANQDYPPERAPFELAPMGSGRGRGQVFPGTVLAGPVEPPKAPQSRAETGARARTEAKMNAKIEKAKKGV